MEVLGSVFKNKSTAIVSAMELENKIEVHKLNFNFQSEECTHPNEKDLGNILNAKWTICVRHFRPMGFKINLETLKFQRRSSRILVEIKCTDLKRQVFVKGIFQFGFKMLDEIYFDLTPLNLKTSRIETEYQYLFDETNNCLSFELKACTLSEDDFSKLVIFGCDMTFYINPENYFYFYFKDDYYPSKSDYQDSRNEVLDELSSNLESLFLKRYFTDVDLHCGSKVFSVHKGILSSRSPVFEAMFQAPMKETVDEVVEIEDIVPEIMEAVLEYVYSGKIPGLSESNSYDILSAADKYQLPGLKRICIYFLRSIMSINNVVRTLAFADLYDADLKKVALNFICKEFGDIKTTPEWKKLEKEKVALTNEVLMNMIDFIGSR